MCGMSVREMVDFGLTRVYYLPSKAVNVTQSYAFITIEKAK
jgi:hypothetical protein